mmetsp:Transcript_4831/g.5807  ORF Transcript_4831/g.5807 Transcript_4831/m.5807 type:complete len:107 (-) Transcript_4831:1131-1451(-)
MHLSLGHVTEEARARHCTVHDVDYETAKAFHLQHAPRKLCLHIHYGWVAVLALRMHGLDGLTTASYPSHSPRTQTEHPQSQRVLEALFASTHPSAGPHSQIRCGVL